MGEVRLRDREIFCLANSMAGEEQFWKRRPSFTFEATISHLRLADSAQNTDQDQLQVSVKTARVPHVESTLTLSQLQGPGWYKVKLVKLGNIFELSQGVNARSDICSLHFCFCICS